MINYNNIVDHVSELTDEEKWEWVRENQSLNITVHCDNDHTYITFDDYEGESDEPPMIDFHEYIGWAEGVYSLLNAVGIKAESV